MLVSPTCAVYHLHSVNWGYGGLQGILDPHVLSPEIMIPHHGDTEPGEGLELD